MSIIDTSGNHNHGRILGSAEWRSSAASGAAPIADADTGDAVALASNTIPLPFSSLDLHSSVVVADSASIVLYTLPAGGRKGVFRRFDLDTGVLTEERMVGRSTWGLGCAAASHTSASGALWGVNFPGMHAFE